MANPFDNVELVPEHLTRARRGDDGLHPIMAAALAPFISPAPECVYCYLPVLDGSVVDYDFGASDPAHPDCADKAAEAAFEDAA